MAIASESASASQGGDELTTRTSPKVCGHRVSPDFYGWVFPKYDHVAVGTGTMQRTKSLIRACRGRSRQGPATFAQKKKKKKR